MSNSASEDEWDGDVLSRKKYSIFLTKYLEGKGEACVININAPWGFGKTFFLEKWYQDIKKTHPAVYFNAWKNDYSDDPLISIISCINKDLTPLLPESPERIKAVKGFLSKSGSMIKKLTPILIKASLSKALGESGAEALIEATDDDKETITELSGKFAEELLNSHESISKSIDDFKESVISLINMITKDGGLKTPLFVFIDELDRCRPLYSIELLERIKHILDIPEVIFIVASDTQQLSHSVKAVYGEGFNGEIYLRRFFDQIYTLPEPDCIEFTTLLFNGFKPSVKYFKYHVDVKGISAKVANKKHILACEAKDNAEIILLFSLFAKFFKLDLRTQKQCFDRFIAIESSLPESEELHFAYLIFLIMLDAKHPTKFKDYFGCSASAQKKTIIDSLASSPDALIMDGDKKYTAKNLIEQYGDKVLLPRNELMALTSSGNNVFNEQLMASLITQYGCVQKYRERVEMSEALG